MPSILLYRILFLVICFFAIYVPMEAQDAMDNTTKYWRYRARQLGQDGQGGFVSIGLGQGMSITAQERHLTATCVSDWYLHHHKCGPHEGTGRLHWGDATLYHGFYLSILALEYVNLEAAGGSTKAVAQELWYALEAFERVDSMAEVALGLPGKKDGCFIRDDVAQEFYVAPKAPQSRRFAKEGRCIDCITSAYACGDPSAERGSFISQDQVMGLLIGFGMVEKLVGDKYYDPKLPSFGEKAALNTHRIASFMGESNWKLRDPSGAPIPDKWGGNALGMSFPISMMANTITKGRYKKNYLQNGAGILGRPIFDLLQQSLGLQHGTNVVLGIMGLTLLPKRPLGVFARKARRHDVLVFPLIRAILFDQPMHKSIQQSDFDAILDSAPIDGPCFGIPNCEAPDGWKSFDRWIHPHFKNGNPYGVHAEMPGLDYMLLYNLYHYYYLKESVPYQTPKQLRTGVLGAAD